MFMTACCGGDAASVKDASVQCRCAGLLVCRTMHQHTAGTLRPPLPQPLLPLPTTLHHATLLTHLCCPACGFCHACVGPQQRHRRLLRLLQQPLQQPHTGRQLTVLPEVIKHIQLLLLLLLLLVLSRLLLCVMVLLRAAVCCILLVLLLLPGSAARGPHWRLLCCWVHCCCLLLPPCPPRGLLLLCSIRSLQAVEGVRRAGGGQRPWQRLQQPASLPGNKGVGVQRGTAHLLSLCHVCCSAAVR